MTFSEVIVMPTFVTLSGWLRAWSRLKRRWCSFLCLINGGHLYLKHSAHERMVLKCYYCGDETRGWDV